MRLVFEVWILDTRWKLRSCEVIPAPHPALYVIRSSCECAVQSDAAVWKAPLSVKLTDIEVDVGLQVTERMYRECSRETAG